jgi:hypothetical protein
VVVSWWWFPGGGFLVVVSWRRFPDNDYLIVFYCWTEGPDFKSIGNILNIFSNKYMILFRQI